MSIVPRYEFIVSDTPPLGQVVPVDNGELCKYADHVVAVAAAREDEREKQRSEWVKDSLPRKYGIDSGWIVSETTACTCGMGRGSEYGHEAFCGLEQEAPVEEFDGWVKFILKAASEQGQREGWQAGFDYAWPRGMQAQRDEVTYAETDDAYEQGQRDEREACIALVETVAQSGAYIDYVEIDSVIAAIRARFDGGES